LKLLAFVERPLKKLFAARDHGKHTVILHVTMFATEIKISFSRSEVLQLLQNFLAKSNMSENIHEAELLQPITEFDEG